MGRIKTALVKRVTLELLEKHNEKFAESFAENKQLVSDLADVPSKKIRNVIAGYVTRLKKKQAAQA